MAQWIADGADFHEIEYAIRQGALDDLKREVRRAGDVNVRSPGLNETPLHIATEDGNLEAVQFLLERGADPNLKDAYQRMPLDRAIDHSVEMTRLLLEHDADPNVANRDSYTPLHFAARAGKTEIVASLIEHGARIDALNNEYLTPLHLATATGQYETVRYLLENGAPLRGIDVPSAPWQPPTPALEALRNGRVWMAGYLLFDAGNGDLSEEDPGKLAAAAAHHGEFDLMLRLLEMAADQGIELDWELPEQKNPDYTAAVIDAAQAGDVDAANELMGLRNQAIRAERIFGRTALANAVSANHLRAAETLLLNGADVNVPNYRTDLTPLHFAVRGDNPEMIRLLLEHGADPDAPDANGKTPFDDALKILNPIVMRLLLEHDASLPATAVEGGAGSDLALEIRSLLRNPDLTEQQREDFQFVLEYIEIHADEAER